MIRTWVEKVADLLPALDELRFERELPEPLDFELGEIGRLLGGWSCAKSHADWQAHMTHLQERALIGTVHTGHWSAWSIGQGGDYDRATDAGNLECERLAKEFHKRASKLIADAGRVLA